MKKAALSAFLAMDEAEAPPNWSEWADSNCRPPAPEAGALPGCATLRQLKVRAHQAQGYIAPPRRRRKGVAALWASKNRWS